LDAQTRPRNAVFKTKQNHIMKATTLITLGLLAASVSFSSAQEQGQRPQRGERGGAVTPEILAKYDKDGDGKLSEEERKPLQEERRAEAEKRRAENLKKYDKDGDGKLSQEETKAMREEQAAKRKALTEKYDANKNGRLDEDELKAARDAGEEVPQGGFGGARGQGGPGGQGGRGARGGQGGEAAPKAAE
jgi:hypothetical protein